MTIEYGSEKGYEFGETTGLIIGAAKVVHQELGPGYREFTYRRALEIELRSRNISFATEVEIPIFYRDEQIDTRRADLVVKEVIVELKTVEALTEEHIAQLAMYLKASRRHIGLLLNFGATRLGIKRVVRQLPST